MKTKLFCNVVVLTMLITTFADFYAKGQATTNNTTAFGDYIGSDVLATLVPIDFRTANVSRMTLTAAGDLNIIGGAKGYQIGTNPVLYTGGDPTSVFVGGQIAFPAYTLTNGSNVIMGWNTYNNFTGGYSNTIIGVYAAHKAIDGHKSTYIGDSAGFEDQHGFFNTYVGYQCGALTQGYAGGANFPHGDFNTMCGYSCGYHDSSGYANNYYGKYAGFWNNGHDNCMFGGHSGNGLNSYTGDSNSFFGNYSAVYVHDANGNVIIGYAAESNVRTSVSSCDDNVMIGDQVCPINPGGYYNIALGYRADAYTLLTMFPPQPINNAVAIGAEVLVQHNNQFILGNNDQMIGIGMNFSQTGPMANLEIRTDSTPAPPFTPPGYYGYIGHGYYNSTNYYSGSGYSGLKFRDLTSKSTTVDPLSSKFGVTNPYPSGVLSIDGNGNVIYVSNNGIGYCSVLSSLTNNGGYDLSTKNFYFKGNQSSALAQNDVAIGNDCSYTPQAKLDVFQNSGATPSSALSIGIYVENDDLVNGPTVAGYPVIGIKSYVPASGSNVESVAGWFEAPGGSSTRENDAIIVPPNGGVSGFGITNPSSVLEMEVNQPNGGTSLQANSTASATTNFGMQGIATSASYWNVGVQGSAGVGTGTSYNQGVYGLANNTYGYNYGVVGWANSSSGAYGLYSIGDIYTTGSGYAVGLWNPSDSTIKRKVNNLSNAISIIKKLQPRTYYYDSINKFNLKLDTSMHYGFIAQELRRTVPCMVRTIATPPQWDTAMQITVPASTINTVDYSQFAAILTKGMQEQQQTIDSLHNTVDSLRNAFKNIQSCLTQLCNNGHGASRHNGGGGGNSGDSNATMLNTQDITLSGLANAPLLYQNIPNPFSTGTKINYFLPASTQGASIVFYDTYGNKIKTVELSQTGNGTLDVTPDNLTSGIYSYSLVVNGNVVDTKRMILQK